LGRDAHRLGEIVQPHFALSQHDIEIDDDGHGLDGEVLFLAKLARFIQDPSEEHDETTDE
jgi:hypothetical protein